MEGDLLALPCLVDREAGVSTGSHGCGDVAWVMICEVFVDKRPSEVREPVGAMGAGEVDVYSCNLCSKSSIIREIQSWRRTLASINLHQIAMSL